MASITFGKTGSRPYGILTVTETATSTADNTSTLAISLVLKRPYSISSSATKTASCTVNGTTYSWSGAIGGSGDLTLISRTLIVPHNADGTKTVSFSASIALNITWSGASVGTITGSGSMALTNIAVKKPSIGTVSYADENSASVAITGNDQQIVQNQSKVTFTATDLTAYNSATITSCTVTVNGDTRNMTISGTTATVSWVNINSGTDVSAVFTVTDSNGLSTSKTITVIMVAWSVPTALITAQRQNNYYSQTSLTVDAGYSSIGSNAVTISYTATEDTGTVASVSGSLQDNVTATITLDNLYSWTITVTLTDSFGGKATYKVNISVGMPIIYFDTVKSSVGINCFPVGEKTLEVNGIDVTAVGDTGWKTGTTSTVGNISLGLNISSVIVSAVWVKDSSNQWLVSFPFLDQYGNWYAKVIGQSATPTYALNTSIQYRVYYKTTA